MAYLPDTPIWKDDSLGKKEKLILLCLKFHIWKNTDCYVGQQTIAKETKYSPPEVRKAIKALEKLGYITVERREYTTHIYKLCPAKFTMPGWKNVPTPGSFDTIPPVEKIPGGGHLPFHKVLNTKSQHQEINQDNNLCAEKPAQKKLITNLKKQIGENEYLEDIQDNQQNQKTPNFEDQWKKAITENFPGTFVASFTEIELKMVKDFKNRIGSHDPIEVMQHAVKNWVGFCCFVKKTLNHPYFPAAPTLEYLLKHCAEAVNFCAKAKAEIIWEEALLAKKLQHEAALKLLEVKKTAEQAKADAETDEFIFIPGPPKKPKVVTFG